MEKSAGEGDHVFDQDGFKVIVAKDLDNTYEALEIGYINNEMGKGFTIRDTAKASCSDSGCGGCG